MDLLHILGCCCTACVYISFRWGPFVHSLGIVQWNSTRRDHPGNPGRVFGSGPVTMTLMLSGQTRLCLCFGTYAQYCTIPSGTYCVVSLSFIITGLYRQTFI